MKNKKHFNIKFTTLSSFVFVVLCLVIFTSHFVLARDGNEDNEQNNTSNEHVQETENTHNEVKNTSRNEVKNQTRNETRSNRERNETTSSKNEIENETENETADNHTEDNETNTVNNETNTTKEHGKSCEARQASVVRIATRAVTRGNNIITVFTKITTQTEEFYTAKGNALSNYDTLVADVAAKKAAAQTAIATVQNLSAPTCPIADSKTAFAPYKDAIAAEIDALKAYKTSVQHLVEGVASVQPDDATETEDNSTNTFSNTTNTTNEVTNETR